MNKERPLPPGAAPLHALQIDALDVLGLLRRLRGRTDRAAEGCAVLAGEQFQLGFRATLLERVSPGAIASRKEAAGRLYNVAEFAAEVALAAVESIPADRTRYVGDVSDFLAAGDPDRR